MNIHAFDVAVVLIAIAQALIVLLTWGRDREIKRLHDRIDQQQLLVSEITGWLKRDVLAKTLLDKPDREPIHEPTANDPKAPEPATIPKDLADTIRPSTPEDELQRAAKTIDWSREIVAGLRAGLKVSAPPEPEITRAPEPAITPKDAPDTIRPSPAADDLGRATKAFKWFKEDADEPREIVQAREVVAGLKGGAPLEPSITPKDSSDTVRPSTTEDEDELKRATKAINWLKEDIDKARETFAVSHGTPPEKTG